jgi:hypothetical protein
MVCLVFNTGIDSCSLFPMSFSFDLWKRLLLRYRYRLAVECTYMFFRREKHIISHFEGFF